MQLNKRQMIKAKLNRCPDCGLKSEHALPGKGAIPADILFLTDAPTKTEILLREPITGENLRLLRAMLQDACDQAKVKNTFTFYTLNCILCRPHIQTIDSKDYGMQRIPFKRELLVCLQNILYIVKQVSPKIIVFTGNTAEQYFTKEFPSAIKISHPEYHLIYAGKGSPTYNYDVLALARSIKDYLL